jgi:hypothetical protein
MCVSRVVYRKQHVRTLEIWWLENGILQESCQSILIQWSNTVQNHHQCETELGISSVPSAQRVRRELINQDSVPLVTINIRDDQSPFSLATALLQSWPYYLEIHHKKRVGRKLFNIYGQ